jgi:hypothetical protein
MNDIYIDGGESGENIDYRLISYIYLINLIYSILHISYR